MGYLPPGRKNSFHFENGDRVQNVSFPGAIGTVIDSDLMLVEWDLKVGVGTPIRNFMDVWSVRHFDDSNSRCACGFILNHAGDHNND